MTCFSPLWKNSCSKDENNTTHSAGSRHIGIWFLEEWEDAWIGIIVTREHMCVENVAVIEWKICIVKNPCQPLLLWSIHHVFRSNGNNHRQELSSGERDVAVGDKRDVCLHIREWHRTNTWILLLDELSIILHLSHVVILVPTSISAVHMKHHSILFHGL